MSFITKINSTDYTDREIVAGSSKVVVTNGDGVAGNPSIDIDTSAIVISPTLSPNGEKVVEEDFLSGAVQVAAGGPAWLAGNVNMVTANTSVGFPTGTANHPGVVRHSNNSSSSTSFITFSNNGVTALSILASEIEEFMCIIKRTATTGNSQYGAGITSTSASLPFNFIGFQYSSGTISAYCIDNGSVSTVSLGSAYPLGAWTNLSWKRNGTSIDFFVNGILATNISTNLPTTAAVPIGISYGVELSGTQNNEVDYLGYKTKSYSGR